MSSRGIWRWGKSMLAATLSAVALAACQQSASFYGGDPLADEANTSEWLTYGRNYKEQRFGPIDQINDKNVEQLGVAWSLDLNDEVGLTGTPLMVDGKLFFGTGRSFVYAVDAATGKELWSWDPTMEGTKNQRFSAVHGGRGLAYWEGKVITATSDGRVVAIDAKTGDTIWTSRAFEDGRPLYITGAPKVLDGKVLIGHAGAEIGRSRAYVKSLDAETGKELWRFHVVPGNPDDGFESKAMEIATNTWTGEWWRYGGGGQVWDGSYVYDSETDTILIGTGCGTPWNRAIRSPQGGDNLFLSSIVALDADTGNYKWHYQTTPAENWDYDSVSPMILADLEIDGKLVKTLMQAPKNGFFYVLDRTNGKLISATPYVDKMTWATGVDMETGRPTENPAADYVKNGDYEAWPTDWGAHSWQPLSYNPETGLVYIPTIEEGLGFTVEGVDKAAWEGPYKFDGQRGWETGVNLFEVGEGRGYLQAWDPVKKERVWRVPVPGVWSPGVLSTAGNLVFQGNVGGDLVAYNATDGKELWRHALGLGITAPPITYTLNGKQYIALLVGWGGGWAAMRGEGAAKLGYQYGAQTRRLVVFSLGGNAKLEPLAPRKVVEPLPAPQFKVDAAKAARGGELYLNCEMCHGPYTYSGGVAPDLRASGAVLDEDTFRAVMRDGILRSRGMPNFSDYSDEELDDLRHFVRQQAETGLKTN